MSVVISCNNISKCYELGSFNHKSFVDDLYKWLFTQKNHNSDNIIWSIKNVTFEVNKGECIGIVGKNGSGKSTLLRLLAGLTKPDSGQIITKGRIASILQVGAGFNPELTGKENIYLYGSILGMSIKETASKIDEIIQFSELDKFIDTPIKRYSAGMQMRLAFSVAINISCDILLLDEVLTVGDHFFLQKSLEKIRNLINKKGLTTVIVSHNESEISSLCSKVIFLENGIIKEMSIPEKVYQSYHKNYSLDQKLKNITITNRISIDSISFEDKSNFNLQKNNIIQGEVFSFNFRLRNLINQKINFYLTVIIKSEKYGPIGYFGNTVQQKDICINPQNILTISTINRPVFFSQGKYKIDIIIDENINGEELKHEYKDIMDIYIHAAVNENWNLPSHNKFGITAIPCTKLTIR